MPLLNNSETENGCKWYFIPEAPNHQKQGYQGLETIFQQGNNKEWSFAREILQNSLDARDNQNEPIHVVFSFGNISKSNYPNFFALSEHVDQCCNGINNTNISKNINSYLKQSSGIIPFLKVSDYNTKGLINGNIQKVVYSSGFGQDATDLGMGGAFGYGHNVYIGLSPIRSFIVSSYDKNKEWSFAGLSNLMSHNYNGQDVSNSGYYTSADNGDYLTRKEAIPRIFRRSEQDGFGTDVFIMGYNDSQEHVTKLIYSILANYWMAIFFNRMTIEVKSNSKVINISKDSLGELLHEYFEKDTSEYNPLPYYNAVLNISRALNNYDKTKYRYIEFEHPFIGKVRLFVNIDKEQRHRKYIEYMRQPLMLIMAKRIGNGFPYPMSAVFLCDNDEGNQLLRSMESPRHDNWDNRDMRIDKEERKKYNGFIGNLTSRIRNIIEEIFDDKDVEIITLNTGQLLNTLYVKESKKEVGAPKENGKGQEKATIKPKKLKVKLQREEVKADVLNPIDGVGEDPGNGKYGGGRGKKHVTPGGGTPTPGSTKKFKKVNRNKKGTVGEAVGIDYDVVAIKKEEQFWHRLFITPSATHTNNILYISIGTDVTENDSDINIVEAVNKDIPLKINGNCIKNVAFEKDKMTIIDILFSDNLKHSLKIISLLDEHK